MELRNIYTDTDEAFLNVHDNIVWLENEQYFTWTSEKDGWRHLYKVSRDGKSESLITKGDFDVMSISCIVPKGGYVYYMASPYSAIDRYLYRSRLDGKGEAERVTPEGEAGYHGYNISGNAQYALHTFQNATTPTVYEMISIKKHQTIKVMQDNKALKERYDSLGLAKKEFFRVDIGEAILDGWMIKPKNFDPSQKYPVIFHIYGEPASSTVLNTWSSNDLWHQFLAQQGYILMSIDPRGTNMPKGREWRKSIYGKVGTVGPQDHAEAVQIVLSQYSFLDPSRVGIWGWSGGGSSTQHALFKYPEIYKTGIAVAGVSMQNLYDTIYQERYMGLPQTNPEGFYNGSPLNFAKNLQGNLFLIHGTGDDNVHYQCHEMLVNELIKHNKMFSMMSYPMRAHGIYEGENTTYHLYQTMLNYWLENL
jgi:dipeptidyl-peptidase-4